MALWASQDSASTWLASAACQTLRQPDGTYSSTYMITQPLLALLVRGQSGQHGLQALHALAEVRPVLGCRRPALLDQLPQLPRQLLAPPAQHPTTQVSWPALRHETQAQGVRTAQPAEPDRAAGVLHSPDTPRHTARSQRQGSQPVLRAKGWAQLLHGCPASGHDGPLALERGSCPQTAQRRSWPRHTRPPGHKHRTVSRP